MSNPTVSYPTLTDAPAHILPGYMFKASYIALAFHRVADVITLYNAGVQIAHTDPDIVMKYVPSPDSETDIEDSAKKVVEKIMWGIKKNRSDIEILGKGGAVIGTFADLPGDETPRAIRASDDAPEDASEAVALLDAFDVTREPSHIVVEQYCLGQSGDFARDLERELKDFVPADRS